MDASRVVALGFFDGVHIGHGALLAKTRQRADELGCKASVMTFDAHPDAVITGQPVSLLNTMADRELLMKRLYGMDEVIFAHFDHAMMTMPWQQFIDDFLVGQLQARHVVCGHDFCFGYRGEGTPERLQAACKALGIGCDIIAKVQLDGVTVSSTGIRAMIAAGELEAAARFLGHQHILSGIVCHGNHIGSRLGSPTANLPIPETVIVPPYGVYAAKLLVGKTAYSAVVNIGIHPTAGALAAPVLEAWILDFTGDLYGQQVTASLYSQLRPEQSFPTLDALRQQILLDAEKVKQYFQLSFH